MRCAASRYDLPSVTQAPSLCWARGAWKRSGGTFRLERRGLRGIAALTCGIEGWCPKLATKNKLQLFAEAE